MSITDSPKVEACAEWLLKLDKSELDGEMMSGIHVQEKSGKTQDQIKRFLIEKYSNEIAEHIAFNDTFGSHFPVNKS